MTQQLEEAPYTYIWEETNVDGKRVKVWKLGKDGKAKLDATISRSEFQHFEHEFWTLRNFLNYLSFDDERILLKLVKALLDNFPKTGSIRYRDIPQVHPCLDFNHTLTYKALERLVNGHHLVKKRGWVKRVINTEA